MSEWDEKKMDEELEALLQNMPDQDELEKRINQSINKRIRRTVFHTLLGVMTVLLIVFLYVDPMMNHIYFNPYKLNQGSDQKVLEILRDYCETVHPYREVMSLDVKKKGFARYKLEMKVADLTKSLTGNTSNVWMDINLGTYGDVIDADSVFTQNEDRFTYEDTDKEDIMNKISEFPQSAVVYLSVSEVTPKSIDELRNLGVELQWFQVYQPNVEFQGGMNYQPRGVYAEDDKREEMTEQELIEAYISNLTNICRYEEVWLGLRQADDGSNTVYSELRTAFADTLRDAKLLTALTSENYCVYGKRDEVISFLQENTFDSILIENVNLW